MRLAVRKEKNATIVSVKGRLDAVSAPRLERKLLDWTDKGETCFIFDFNKLDYISSAGLRIILATSKRVKPEEGKIFLCRLRGVPREIFKISGFDSIFRIFESVEDALENL